MKKYKVRTACEIAGVWHPADAEIELTDEQARELAPPFGRVVDPVVVGVSGIVNRAVITGDSDGGLDRTKRGGGKPAK